MISISAHVAVELSKLPFDGKGVECQFYRLNDEIGFKFYADERVARNTFQTQKYYHSFGMAPDCWDLGEITIDGNTYSGYFTEVVTPIIDISLSVPRKIYYIFSEWVSQVACELCDELNRINPSFEFDGDMHEGNFGIDKNGKFVVIDMSHASFNGRTMCYELMDFGDSLTVNA